MNEQTIEKILIVFFMVLFLLTMFGEITSKDEYGDWEAEEKMLRI